ncbi:MAG: 2-oxoacid:acceptor oxidoreductase subunit alpha [Actinomycetia bacterium]|nr:2-oxoacid:acceptor oxidoreductase subunit alpha [Actinomycetes bacterium]MCP5030158.1 2-oxoacid:acceptor oxidoreductase subunit alpha [Actinomycetes bacterium]
MTDIADRVETEVDHVVIRFAGDSGDGMQLTGDRFTSASALAGNDLATLPEFPAEIRAPQGSLAGVSAFQVHISDHDIHTPGDAPDLLVAMNPAALKSELSRLRSGGAVIINDDAFDERNLEKAGFVSDPRQDGSLSGYIVHRVAMTSLTIEATADLEVKKRDAERSKNFFALGLISWMYSRPVEPTLNWIEQKFARMEAVVAANTAAFKAGYNFGETTEMFANQYKVKAAPQTPGTYTNVTGNIATSWGMVAAGQLAKLPVFLGSYPITPASEILHELSRHKNFGVRTFQAEDEIAGVGAALGAAFGGHLAFTTTSGPGVALKGETIGLAVSIELPLVIVDVQRGGPSTGLPTKTEASDLMLAMYGRHGEAPMPIVAASTPAHCFDMAIEASRIALKYRTPVILLTDGYLANGSEPWRLPDVDTLPDISVSFTTEYNATEGGEPAFHPYLRDEETLARPWAIPGTPGLEHRVGGLEREVNTGNVSHDHENHGIMTDIRQAKIAGIANDIPLVDVKGEGESDVLMIGWGSTAGAITSAADRLVGSGIPTHTVNLTHLNPFPSNLGEVLSRYSKIFVPELNKGQLVRLLRAEYLVDAKSISKVMGSPFTATELVDAVREGI